MKQPRPIKAIGRKRRAAGWMLLTLGVLVAALWVASGWRVLSIRSGGRGVWITNGLGFYFEGRDDPPRVHPQYKTLEEAALVNPGIGPPRTARDMASRFNQAIEWLQRSGPRFVLWNLPKEARAQFDFVFYDQRWAVLPVLPVMLLPLSLAGPLLMSGFRAAARRRAGRCDCGYSLAGLTPDAPCPECGRKASATA